jgi:ubiquinone/menaquinone biosynthesis C-methylase UbiE
MNATTTTQHAVREFYDTLATDYDAMTGFEQRFEAERPVLRSLVEHYAITTALDAGCGTGFHSLVLAQLGVHVTAVDISSEMLAALRRHSEELKVSVRAVQADFGNIPDVLTTRFDAVFCLGNSLVHFFSEDEVRQALRAFASVLKPKALVVIQLLNYDRILSERTAILATREVEGTKFVRYYDYGKERLRFNVAKISNHRDSTEQSVISVPLRPLRKDELVQHLMDVGFRDVHCFGSLSMNAFDWLSSKDLVVIARTT